MPALTAPVMDTAHMMSPDARSRLNQYLLDYSRENGSQIMVLTVDNIAPDTPFDYAVRVMDTWKPGRRGVDDGVVLILVKNERKTHLAVGRGLEGAIPDAYAKRILDDVLRPYMQAGRVDEGIQQSVLQIEKLIAGENLLPPESPQDDGGGTIIVLIFGILFAATFFRALFGRTLGSLVSGGAGFAFALLLGVPFVFALFVGFFTGIVSLTGVALGGGGFTGGHGGFGGGGFGGGGLGGGFGGGGGGFGGGGASGGW